MRILHVVAGEKWTGVAAVVFDWTRALVDAGIEAQFAFVGESPLARRILPVGWARPLLSHPHGLRSALRDLPALRAAIERERFDVVHAHLSHDHYLAGLALPRGPVRLVRTLHHMRHAKPDLLLRGLFRRTRAFAFANRDVAAAFGASGPVHSPAVDTAAFAPGEKPAGLRGGIRLPAGGFILGTVGKMARGRGHEEAIDAAAPLAGNAFLLHVGKGEHRPALEARAERAGTASRNLWADYQEETLPFFYRAMDVFLFTASGSQQGQRAILEAMASGIPVAALDVPGVRDLVTDGVEGFVARDVASLTEALRRLAGDGALRRRMAVAARRRALDFESARIAGALARFYETIPPLRGSPGFPAGATSATPSGAPGRSSRRGR